MSDDEQRIYRYEQRTDRDLEPAQGDDATIAAVGAHLERHIGPVETVFHEIVSDLVHVDIHMVLPAPDRPYAALMTSGMSDRPMTLPAELDGELSPHAEICLLLPPDWPLDEDAWQDERHYWPIRWMKVLARFPHEYDSWLGAWHTMPNGDPPEPVAPGSPFVGVMIAPPLTPPPEFGTLELPDGRVVTVLTFLPLHADEMELKVRSGADPLLEALDAAGVGDVLDGARPSALGGRRRRGLFRRR